MKYNNVTEQGVSTQQVSKALLVPILIAISLALGVSALDVTAVMVALPKIQQGLGASNGQLQWVFNGYILGLGTFSLAAGSFSDYYGKIKLFFIGALLFMISSALCAFAPEINTLIIARIVQGISAVLMMVPARVLVINLSPSGKEGRFYSACNAVMMVMSLLGPVIAIALMHVYSWRAIFSINIVVCLFIALASLIAIKPLKMLAASAKKSGHKPDFLGFLYLVVASFAIVYGVMQLHSSSLVGVAAFIIGVISVIACYFHCKRTPYPVINFKALGNGNLMTGLFFIAFMQGVILSTLYFSNYSQQVLRVDLLQAITLITVLAVGFIISAFLSGKTYDRFGLWPCVIIGLIALIVFYCLGLIMLPFYALSGLCCVAFGLGLGSFFITNAVSVSTISKAEEHEKGLTSGVLGWCRQNGGAIWFALYMSAFNAAALAKLKMLLKSSGIYLSQQKSSSLLSHPFSGHYGVMKGVLAASAYTYGVKVQLVVMIGVMVILLVSCLFLCRRNS